MPIRTKPADRIVLQEGEYSPLAMQAVVIGVATAIEPGSAAHAVPRSRHARADSGSAGADRRDRAGQAEAARRHQ
jgi:hypothetical protein